MDAPSFIVESPSCRHKTQDARPSLATPKSASQLRLGMAPRKETNKPYPAARKRPRRSPPREPPPPPPPSIRATSTPVDLTISATTTSVNHVPLHEPSPESRVACVAPVPETPTNLQTDYHKCYKDEPVIAAESETVSERTPNADQSFAKISLGGSVNSCESSPIVARYILIDEPTGQLNRCQTHNDIMSHIDQDSSSDSDDMTGIQNVAASTPRERRYHHKPLARQPLSPISDGEVCHTFSSPPLSTSVPAPPPLLQEQKQLFRTPEDDIELPEIGQTRPVLKPKTDTQNSTSPRHHLKWTVSNPELISDGGRGRSVSFLNSKAGEERGRFSADYLGSKVIDCYLGCVDVAAKQLVDVRSPVEVVAYVSSEKVRLAPPKNAAVLFKSFSMKEIFLVQKCTKNKRIFGIIIWKPKSIPVCHVLRCSDNIVANSFYESVWVQSQLVDDVTLNKVTTHSECPVRSMSVSSSDSEQSDSPKHTPLPSSDILHNFSATYVGSAVAGRLHSISEVIRKVLSENKPSQANDVCVMLSLSQVKLVEDTVESTQVVVHAMHETSRIRAIGVYSHDKRFIGYIIKEEGKPLAGHVLRCNSAGLMVSLMSFLRQSCQFTSYQRGGSFYEELSTDDSEDFNQTLDGSHHTVPESSSFIKRLRSFTIAYQRSSSNTSTVSQPSFVSHTPPICKPNSPTNVTTDSPSKNRDSVHSPTTVVSALDFTEEDYAMFSVTYVGSATLERPLTRQSLLNALRVFDDEGVAAGKAAVAKNVVHMQVSALGINLSDKKHQLFTNRNYPRKQLEGYCVIPNDSNYFAFASRRPGFPSSMKVHVFKKCVESTQQISDSIKFWLEIDPTIV